MPLSIDELKNLHYDVRLNTFRRFLSYSRMNRLAIHLTLVKSAVQKDLRLELERESRMHAKLFYNYVDSVIESGFKDELLMAINEEYKAMENIISRYEERYQNSKTEGKKGNLDI
jgi:hypothetical protein